MRFGFTHLESYLHVFGVRVVVMEHTAKDDPRTKRKDFQPEPVEDLIAITSSFSARIYGKRGGKMIGSTVHQVMTTLVQEGVLAMSGPIRTRCHAV